MSIFLKMAWRNIRRNLRRTIITLSAITFGLAAMIVFFGFTDGFHAQWVENTVKAYTGHIQIYRSGYRDDPQLNRSIANAAEIIKELKTESAVDTYAERVEVQGLISTAENSYGVLIRGIDPGEEVKITGIKERIIKGGYLNKDKGRGVLIGYRLAEKLNAEIGDKIVLMVQATDGSLTAELFRLQGTFRMGAVELDSSFAVVTLKDAQALSLLGNRVTEIAVMLKSPGDVLPVSKQLKERLVPSGYEVYTWEELMPALQEMIGLDNIFMYLILLVVLVVVALGILNTMIMSIMERTREFGIMMAVGTSPRNVILLVMLESFFIGIIGIIFGAGIGIGVNRIISIKGFNLSRWGGATEFFAILDPVIYPETDLINVLWSCAIVFLTALIVSLYPAVRAARLRPAEAMHYV
ncbi:MAG: ABC transporter permease [Nitrospirae bacterium]|nr:ABC transporter permease [Nitrospirota bacterium]